MNVTFPQVADESPVMSAAVPFDPSYHCEEDVRVLMAVEPGLCVSQSCS